MKTVFLILLISFLGKNHIFSQNEKFSLLASYGASFTNTNSYTANYILQYIKNDKQLSRDQLLDLQLIYKLSKVSKESLWINFAITNTPLLVKYNLGNNLNSGALKLNNIYPRLAIGYLKTTKKLYINHLFWETKSKKGFFIQFEPKIAMALSRLSNTNKMVLNSIDGVRLEANSSAHSQFGLLLGTNINLGINEKSYFFIALTQLLNFYPNLSNGYFFVKYNNFREVSYSVHNTGSGLNLSAGVRLFKFGKYK
jgi:hypothetical protein